MDDVATVAFELYNEFINKAKAYELSNQAPDQATMTVEDQKQLDRLSCQIVTLTTCKPLF